MNTLTVTERALTGDVLMNFALDTAGKVTISLFRGEDLVTEIIPAIFYEAGEHKEKWNKKSHVDFQQVLSGQYRFVMTVNNLSMVYEGRIANNSKNPPNIGGDYGYSNFTIDIAALGGYLYYANNVGEANTSLYRALLSDNKVQLQVYKGTRSRISSVCTSSTRVYVKHQSQLGNDFYSFVSAVLPDAANTQVMFNGGVAFSGNRFFAGTYPSVVALVQNQNEELYLDIAVTSDDKKLLTIWATGIVRVTNLDNNTTLADTPVPGATRINRQTNTLFWIVVNGVAKQYNLTTANTLTATGKVLSGVDTVDNVECSADGTALSVTLTGTTYQLKEYATDTLNEVSSIGQVGGYTLSTLAAWQKLALSPGQTAITYDSNGRWLIEYKNHRISHFDAEFQLDDFIEWQDAMYAIAVDELQPNYVMIGFNEYYVDNTKNPQATGAYRLNRNYYYRCPAEYTADSSKFTAVSFRVTFPNNRTFAICKNANTGLFDLVELNDGIFFRQQLPYAEGYSLYSHGLYYYTNNTRDPGGIAKYNRLTITGFDANGPIFSAPIVDFSKVIEVTDPILSGSDQGGCGEMIAPGEYLTCEVSNGGQSYNSQGFRLGKYKTGENVFTWKTQTITGRGYAGPFPMDERFINTYDITRAGARALAIKGVAITLQPIEFWTANNRGPQANVFKFFARNGQYLGWNGTYRTLEGYNMIGQAGNGYSYWATAIDDDTVRVFQATENVPYGMLVFKLSGFAGISTVETVMNLSAATAVVPDSIRLTDKLPKLAYNILDNTAGWRRIPATDQAAGSANGKMEVKSDQNFDKGSINLNSQNNAKVYYDIDLKGKVYPSWLFSCVLTILDTYPAGTDYVGLNIRDSAGNMIAQFRSDKSAGVTDMERGYFNLNINGKPVYRWPSGNDNSPVIYSPVILINPHSFYIVCTAGIITCGFAGLLPVTVAATGDSTRPARIEIVTTGSPMGSGQSMSITDAEIDFSPVSVNTQQLVNT